VGKFEKLIERFLTVPKDFTWDEMVAVLAHFGYSRMKTGKTGGSRRKFVNGNNVVISLHEPHPDPRVKEYAIKQVIETLKQQGDI
jgi:hypothetical protein